MSIDVVWWWLRLIHGQQISYMTLIWPCPLCICLRVCVCVCVRVCVYTHHTPKGTAEEVKHFARDGGGACTNEPDMPSKGFLHFIEDKVIPKWISAYYAPVIREKREQYDKVKKKTKNKHVYLFSSSIFTAIAFWNSQFLIADCDTPLIIWIR